MNTAKAPYWKLFSSALYLSAFTFGGGYVIVPLMKKKFVDELKWIEESEIIDLVAIAQSSPGAIAVNASLIIGYRIAGARGAAATILGTVTPPLLILSIISSFYTLLRSSSIVGALLAGMQVGVAAVICDIALCMAAEIFRGRKLVPIILMFCAFVASCVFKVNVMAIIAVCGFLGVLFMTRRDKED